MTDPHSAALNELTESVKHLAITVVKEVVRDDRDRIVGVIERHESPDLAPEPNDVAKLIGRLEVVTEQLASRGDMERKHFVFGADGTPSGAVAFRRPFDAHSLVAEGMELFVRLGGLDLHGEDALRAVKTQAAFALASMPYFDASGRERITRALERADADWSRRGVSVR